DDLSVIKNLRSSDVEDNVVTLLEDSGYKYKIKVSNDLAKNLKTLAAIDIWERPNPYGICRVDMRGLYGDSVFKIEHRVTAVDDSYRFSYYAKLRKIAREYIGYPLLPLQLYTSGIMHRINYLLDKNSIIIQEAFEDNCRNRMAHSIISAELIRCNNKIDFSNFRELVKGHLDVFMDDLSGDLSDELFEDILSIVENGSPNEFDEGAEVLLEHLSHERNAEVVTLAKKLFKDSHNGKLYCENCGFDFVEKYGVRGDGFIEAHHIKPISEMSEFNITRVEDLVLLCSNCHSIVHVKKPWLTMEQLKKITK
ncbi:MAG: HNH endonuclease, partial [Clostridia bacterium]|nr:HNH endonuclease [Clostridia bacterium]